MDNYTKTQEPLQQEGRCERIKPLVLAYHPLCFIQYFIPEDDLCGAKYAVNKHRLSCADCICDYLFYKQHNGMSTLKIVKEGKF
jgi:hypothetical protein